MNPYRPLHVWRGETTEPHDAELRGLAMLLALLGVTRLIPTLAGEQAFGIEPASAFVMLVVGVLELFEVRRRVRRWIRRWRVSHARPRYVRARLHR